MENYKSTYAGSQIDTAIGRALPGGEIDASLSNKADKTPPVEYDLPLADGVTLPGSGYAKYSKDQYGYIRLSIYGASYAEGKAGWTQYLFATLPAGFRPRKPNQTPVWCQETASNLALVVFEDGQVKIQTIGALPSGYPIYGSVIIS
jgi:hypothetical protein